MPVVVAFRERGEGRSRRGESKKKERRARRARRARKETASGLAKEKKKGKKRFSRLTRDDSGSALAVLVPSPTAGRGGAVALGGERRARPDVSLFERLGPRRPLTRHHRSAGRGGPRRRRARERRAAEVGVVVLEVASSSSAAKGVGSSVLGSSRGGLKRGAPRAVGDVSRVGVDRRGAGDVLFWGRERARERERERERKRERKRKREKEKEREKEREGSRGAEREEKRKKGQLFLPIGGNPAFERRPAFLSRRCAERAESACPKKKKRRTPKTEAREEKQKRVNLSRAAALVGSLAFSLSIVRASPDDKRFWYHARALSRRRFRSTNSPS